MCLVWYRVVGSGPRKLFPGIDGTAVTRHAGMDPSDMVGVSVNQPSERCRGKRSTVGPVG
jgi:hypothetical protein